MYKTNDHTEKQVAENEVKLRECWAARADLQEEFPDIETFVAYAKAANRGDARILKPEGVYTDAE